MSFCTNCGAELAESDRFCASCGQPLETESVIQPGSVSTDPPKRRLSGCVLAAMAGAALAALTIVILLVVLGAASRLTGPAVEALEAHFAALKLGRIETAYQGTSAAFQKVTPLEAYRHFLEGNPALMDVSGAKFDDRGIENDLVTVKGTITDSHGQSRGVQAQLRKEAGVWKIQAIDVPGGADPAPTIPGAVVPPAAAGSSVGVILIGAGRHPDGSLINPGLPIPQGTAKLSADIALLNHPEGERVRVWIEQGANRSEPIESMVEGSGNGNLPFELNLRDTPFASGRYRLVVVLGDDKRYNQDFEVQ